MCVFSFNNAKTIVNKVVSPACQKIRCDQERDDQEARLREGAEAAGQTVHN
jgi:hypothetical protein